MIEKDELQTLMPHKGKMMLLSRVTEYDIEHGIRAEFEISKQCIFYDPAADGVPSYVGFECMAQSISVLSGLRGRKKGEKPKVGFILSVQAVRIDIPLFKNGSLIEVYMKETDCTDKIYTFEGEAYLQNKKVMEGRLMVMEISDEQSKELLGERA